MVCPFFSVTVTQLFVTRTFDTALCSSSASNSGMGIRPVSSREVENIFENSDFVYMLNQAGGDRQILAKQLGISTHQLSYVTHSGEGEGLLFYGSTILPFVDHFPKNTELYRIMTTKPQELKKKEDE